MGRGREEGKGKGGYITVIAISNSIGKFAFREKRCWIGWFQNCARSPRQPGYSFY